ncbi:MAG TPA: hypothetical protein VER58_11180 [Thermoanaerobaculia bacterium]|nr:hypothetical protein [Thermoanaerobaculia bacterium]
MRFPDFPNRNSSKRSRSASSTSTWWSAIEPAIRSAALIKEDFEVYEEGVRQTITNLYEVRRGDADNSANSEIPLELRQRRLLLFVDSSSLQHAKKESVLAAVERFVDQKMRPEDQAMVVCWRLGLHVILPFSSD